MKYGSDFCYTVHLVSALSYNLALWIHTFRIKLGCQLLVCLLQNTAPGLQRGEMKHALWFLMSLTLQQSQFQQVMLRDSGFISMLHMQEQHLYVLNFGGSWMELNMQIPLLLILQSG